MVSVSIKDVAAAAGVSVGTVSNVLNRPEIVRPATRVKVGMTITKLGFVPNASARQLAAGRSRTLAYLVLDASNPFFTDVTRGIEEVAKAENLSLFLCNSDLDTDRENGYLEHLTQLRVRGLLITATDYANPRLTRLREQGVPVVLVDRAPQGTHDWCSVGVDDIAGGDLAMTHLHELGHRKLAFIGGPLAIPQVADRYAGALAALSSVRLGADDLVLLETGGITVAEGRRAGERLLGLPRHRRPTAVFCANDLLALGLLQHLVQHGVSVPDDISIVGYDDIEYAAAAAVPLTTVAQPRQLLGRTAARLLMDEAAHGSEHRHEHVVFRPELIARASTAPARRRA